MSGAEASSTASYSLASGLQVSHVDSESTPRRFESYLASKMINSHNTPDRRFVNARLYKDEYVVPADVVEEFIASSDEPDDGDA